MFHPDADYLLMWGAVIALVILTARVGYLINRYFIHRAHRQALAELRRRMMGAAGDAYARRPQPAPVKVSEAES